MAGQGERLTIDLSEGLADEQPELGWKVNLEREGQYADGVRSSRTHRVPFRLMIGAFGADSAPQRHFGVFALLFDLSNQPGLAEALVNVF